jgi:nucleotidyltransferase/DNA polymerase involved in DNA repair
VRIPKFPIGAVWLEDGKGVHWDQRPLALASDDRVAIATTQAASLGIRHGMTIPAARAMCAGLEARPWDDRAIGRAMHRVTAACLALSPQVTPARPGLWWIGAHGLEGHGGEHGLIRSLLARARRWHPDARVAVASSCIAAWVATWLRGAGRLVPRGSDQALLAQAPLSLIPMDAELRDTLAALGLGTAGQFAALDPGDVEQRFGPAGLAAWRLARGEDQRRPTLAHPVPDDTVAIELPTSTATLEPVLFLVRAALGRLITQVASDGMAVAALEVELKLDESPARSASRRITLAFPLARLEPLFVQCRAVLDDWMLEAPVLGVVVRITERARPAGEQGDLLHTGWRDPAAADAAFARLRAALGAGAVVRPVALDGFAPERRGAWEEGSEEGGKTARRQEKGGKAARPQEDRNALLRLLEPPEPVEVAPDTSAFTWRGRRWPITARGSAERLSGDWWASPYVRDYSSWTSEGTAFVVFLSGETWNVHGWYD